MSALVDAIVGLPPWLALSLVFGLPALVPGVAGMAGMPQGLFTLANVTGGARWAAMVAVLALAVWVGAGPSQQRAHGGGCS